jgi:hypothetical protein
VKKPVLQLGEQRLAAATASVLVKAQEAGLPDAPEKLVSTTAIRFLARAHDDLLDRVRALHALIDQTDPSDPIGVALTEVGLETRPPDVLADPEPRLVRTPAEVHAMTPGQLIEHYCHVMHEVPAFFAVSKAFVVRAWDGMDGCWTDCTAELSRDDALRYWAEKTDGGTHRVAYAEIDYYRIFSGGTRMLWDGSEGQERHR